MQSWCLILLRSTLTLKDKDKKQDQLRTKFEKHSETPDWKAEPEPTFRQKQVYSSLKKEGDQEGPKNAELLL